MGTLLLATLLAATVSAPAPVQRETISQRPVRWSLTAPARVDAGSRFEIVLAAQIDTGWKLYSLSQGTGGPIATTIRVAPPFRSAGQLSAPKPEEYADRNFNQFTEIYRNRTRFTIPVRAPAAVDSLGRIAILVRFQVCTERYCLPPRTDTVTAPVQLVGASSAAVATTDTAPTESVVPPPPTAAQASSPAFTRFAAPNDAGALVRLLWLAVTMGLLSLLTPCILPMIPITIGFFSQDLDGSTVGRRRRAVAALAHAVGIVGSFVVLGVAIAMVFGASGLVRLAASPWFNLTIAALFVAFALNLLGAYELALPASLLTRISTTRSRSRSGAAFLMGSAFALTSFTCTAPFVGTLLTLASQGSWRWPVLGLTAYASAFALPFLALALAPGLLSKLPRAGPWMLTLKAALGLAELALAVKFLSNVDLVLGWNVLSREVVLALWIWVALVIALLVVGIVRSPLDLRPPRVGRLPAIGGALMALGAAAWVASSFRDVRMGELEAYLPPSQSGLLVTRPTGDELAWKLNALDDALAQARAVGKPVIVDFTGYTCTNCRWMEANMFPRSELRPLLDGYVRVRLYTDGVGEPYERQQRYQFERFGTIVLPYYALLRADGEPISSFLGMTRDSEEFAKFLRAGLGDAAATTQ